jgi:hypothetical protein
MLVNSLNWNYKFGLVLKFNYFLNRMDEREKLLQEYSVIYNKHAKEEENVRKSMHFIIKNVSNFAIRRKKSSKPKINSNLYSQLDK